MEAFRLVSVFPHVVLLFFICPSPNKTRTALSDTLTLARANKVRPISSSSLSKQAFIAGSAREMLFYHAREKTSRHRLYF